MSLYYTNEFLASDFKHRCFHRNRQVSSMVKWLKMIENDATYFID